MIGIKNGKAVCRNNSNGHKYRNGYSLISNGVHSNGNGHSFYPADRITTHFPGCKMWDGKVNEKHQYKFEPAMLRLRIRSWAWRHLPKTKPEMMIGFFFCCFVLFFLLRYANRPVAKWTPADLAVFHKSLNEVDDIPLKSERWIVITTINPPTEAVRRLAKIPGWTMLVIGDVKTPSEQWRVEEDIIYLDIKEQERFKFTITPLIPHNSYARKMIGYLYAIKHGAVFIYDTDDDNIPNDNLQTFRFTSPLNYLSVKTSNLTFNPYAHFGQSTIWPRGYPLEHFPTSNSHHYTLCHMYTPAVQQGLVNGDPDVDALFRITRHNHDNANNAVFFDDKAPPVLIPQGTFVPFNSQNTLFTYKALWALALPVSTTFRTCDIYRSYLMQPLLWSLGQKIGFFPANVLHDRNKHSLTKDAEQELDFGHMGKLLRKLKGWQCEKIHFFSCISDLAKDFVHWGFWKSDDADLIDAWLTDLASLGYISPAMKDNNPKTCLGEIEQPLQLVLYPNEQKTILPNAPEAFLPDGATNLRVIQQFLSDICGKDSSLPPQNNDSPFHDTLLIIDVRENSEDIIFYQAQYQSKFRNILYCGTNKILPEALADKLKISYIQVPEYLSGTGCLTSAMNIGYNVSGFLYTPKSALINMETISKHNFHQVWAPSEWKLVDREMQLACDSSNVPCQKSNSDAISHFAKVMHSIELGEKLKGKVRKCFKRLQHDIGGSEPVYLLKDFVFYIPSRLTKIYSQLSKVYTRTSEDSERIELLTVLLLDCIESNSDSLTFSTQSPTSNSDYLFPYNTNFILQNGGNHYIKQTFCQQFQGPSL